MSAAAKAEARRRAILSRGTDRLSKLTSSARGDDAPQFVYPETATPPSPPPAQKANLANFIGDDPLPTPPAASQPPRRAPDPHGSRYGSSGSGTSPPDPSAWSDEQQQQFLRALLSGTPPIGSGSLGPDVLGPNGAMADDPLLALMSNFAAGAGAGKGAGSTPLSQTEARPKTLTWKLLPILHVFSVWALVAFFVFWMEPEAFRVQNSAVVSSSNMWNRWARLATGSVEGSLWSVETIPFFWAFVSLELGLHSMRIFSGFDPAQPPMLLSLALPHLPKPLPSIITYGFGYMQLVGAILDDLAAAVVAIGLFIAASHLHQNWSLP
ncbi:hypothetical protein EDB92DRAFT_1816936 [Lactarius akahatsu]|uniref:Uncharacterized protein n=1 Tax=Lactarius akahatsu TaxID=416441 RepID=A0AAD4LFS5_9AGAM|nr:hypothetical protein EDB92DRAFT_1816936 [Lactarius akahatsu]